MQEQDILYTLALTRMTGFNFATALRLYQELGSGRGVWEHRNDVKEVLPDCTDRLAANLKDWSMALTRAEQEMAFIEKHHLQVLCHGDSRYPQRLMECPDAPIVLYYLGNADLNAQRVVNIVGTRHCTPYGQDLVRRLVADLRQLCPQVLIVSGLAYGVDICAHRQALQQGLETVGVLAHGLDDLYPPRHRETAKQMLTQGGLLTEYMSETNADKANFVRRNRIVAGMSDATILVESAAKGGGLITANIAQDYNRAVFAFPGAVGAPYSEGCNHLIRDNGAALITSAADIVNFMGWQNDAQLLQAKTVGIERDCFPNLSDEEMAVVNVLQATGDMQQSVLAVKTNIPIGQLTALLFQLEMKGVVRPLAGGNFHLLM
ncbi:MAG: DNA-processing protein DprA [Prevotella sp.]|jgi:DNA processing protein|nr:DNA-processing protein DprA [Prevotella sp.]